MSVYVFLANGFEMVEALAPVDILRRAGITVKTVSITDDMYVTSSHDVIVKADLLMTEASFEDAQMFFVPGGMAGALSLKRCVSVLKLLYDAAQSGKIYVAAICAGPIVLAESGILNNKTVVCHPSVRQELTDTGVNVADDGVFVDGNIITGTGMGVSLEFGFTLAAALTNDAACDKIKFMIQYCH